MPDALTGAVTLRSEMVFEARSGSGHTLLLDSAADHGGADGGMRPMELLLLGLGGCTGMDVISLLRKMRQDVATYQVELHADRADEHPRIMREVTVLHVIHGRDLDSKLVSRAIELSATRYCPASAMLSKAAVIHHRCRLIDADTGPTREHAVVDTPGEVPTPASAPALPSAPR